MAAGVGSDLIPTGAVVVLLHMTGDSTGMRSVDAVVIGSGINGMVTAAQLARAGWSVALVERNPEIGGFIASAQRTEPGYLHDVYSSWHPLFITSPGFAALGDDLARHGLTYCNTDGALTASVSIDGRVTAAYRDPSLTAAAFAHTDDRATYLAALDELSATTGVINQLMGSDVSVPTLAGAVARLTRTLGVRGAERWIRQLFSSGRGYTRREYVGDEVDRLWAPWLLHAGLGPDSATGGFMMPLLAATLHGAGLPVVRGGAGNFVAAFCGLLTEAGVDIYTSTEAEKVLLDGHRAVGIATSSGRIDVRRAVVASVTPGALYTSLLGDAPLAKSVIREARSYRPGRAAVQIHVALSAPPTWNDAILGQVPLFHVSDGSSSTGIACAEAEAGLLPRHPTIVVGQQYLLDPSRVPSGAGALWLQLQQVPFSPRGDAAGELDTASGWTADLAAAFADRVIGQLAEHAPGLRDLVRSVDVITPLDLAAYNVNAINGDPYAGSAELDQNFRWRPMAGLLPYRTPVDRLWHIGAATHPGPGLGGGSGFAVAQRLLKGERRLFGAASR